MGLGVIKWTLGTAKLRIALLCVSSIFLSFVYETIQEMENLEEKEIIPKNNLIFITVPAAILDTLWYLWIVLSLIRTIQQLTLRKQTIKLQLYRKFLGILVAAGILALIVIIVEVALNLSHYIVPWKLQWMLDAFWETYYFGLVTAMAILWRPNANNAELSNPEYESASTFDKDDLSDTQIPLDNVAISGELTQRKKVAPIVTIIPTTPPTTAPKSDEETVLAEIEKELRSLDDGPELKDTKSD